MKGMEIDVRDMACYAIDCNKFYCHSPVLARTSTAGNNSTCTLAKRH
jgi:hypothetical protein